MIEEIKQLKNPLPGELWILDDKSILMDDPDRKDKRNRMCLVVYNSKIPKRTYRYIVPCSTSVNEAKWHVSLLGKCQINEDEKKYYNKKSHICLHLFQPIRIEYFRWPIGSVDNDFLLSVKQLISDHLLGIFPSFDIIP